MVSFAQLSKDGGREVNEDSVGSVEIGGKHLFALADGLGGHGGGDAASKLAIEKAIEAFSESGHDAEEDILAECFTRAQDAVMEAQDAKGSQTEMKTTLVLLRLDGISARWGHIGDSRLYVFNEGSYVSRTLDHSVPQMLAITGEIRERDIRRHPDRNRLLRVLGAEWESKSFDLSDEMKTEPGTAFLLCSDGFWELIDEGWMCKTLKAAQTASEWMRAMEKRVLKRGRNKHMDNYSAIAVFVG